MISSKRFVWPILVIGVVTSFAVSSISANSPDASASVTKKQLQAKFERRRATEQYRNETSREWSQRQSLNDVTTESAQSTTSPALHEKPAQRMSASFASASTVPPSPGQEIGFTMYDYQANGSQAHCVARKGGDGANLHFTWVTYDYVLWGDGGPYRAVKYARYSDPENYPNMNPNSGSGYNGILVADYIQLGGYTNIDVDMFNHAQIGLHQAAEDYVLDPYEPWHVQYPYGDESAQEVALDGYDNSCPAFPQGIGGILWPRLAADRSSTALHEIAHSNINDCPEHKLWYWRYDGAAWSGPAFVDNTEGIDYALAVDNVGTKVAVVTHHTTGSYTNVCYTESQSDGLDWLALIPNVDPLPTRVQITNYGTPATQSAWRHLTATYDNASVLHIMWDEQRDAVTSQAAIKHWNSDRNTVRTAALGYWDCPLPTGLQSLNLTKISMGIGDGSTLCQGGAQSNNNYVYCIYTQFGGNTVEELADYSDEISTAGRYGGYMNGEIHLVASNSGGNTWSPSQNLTNTKTPGCNPGVADVNGNPQFPENVCRSEHWATINRVVQDIDISFISDIDAGSIVYGEGSWQMNRVMYLQLPGGTADAQVICPIISSVFEATITPDAIGNYWAYQYGQDSATLTIMNLGNATLSGTISVTDFPGAPTLQVNAGAFSIPPGSSDVFRAVTMSANGADAGLYAGEISILHNEVTKPTPWIIPIEFQVQVLPCSCPCKYDPQCDGVVSDVLDVISAIAVAFRNDPESPVGNCPRTQYDVDANGITDVADVVKVINVAFRNQTVAANYVDPCL